MSPLPSGRFVRAPDWVASIAEPARRFCADCRWLAEVAHGPDERRGTVRCPTCQAEDLLGVAREMKAVARLSTELRAAWSSETSADPAPWTPDNPAHGQSAPTSLVVQDQLGGKLLRSSAAGASHYFNELPSGAPVDISFPRFPPGTRYDEPPVVVERGYLISAGRTAERYLRLARRLEALRLRGSGLDTGLTAVAGC
jgi:hypothetical protein